MANYSTAAAQSAIETLCHHVISATSELDAIVKSVDPANEKLQLLLSVTNTLQRLKQTASDLKSAITATSVVCRTIQKALGRSLQPCSNALAVVDKQLRRLQPGSDLATINPGVIARYEAHSAQNAQLFTLLARILQASSLPLQEAQCAELHCVQVLKSAVSASELVMKRSDILFAELDSNVQFDSAHFNSGLESEDFNIGLDSGSPDCSSTSSAAPNAFFASLTDSFKSFTASLRPKPEPMVVAMCQSASNGHVAHLKGFVSQGVNLTGHDEQGYTALICAVRANQLDAVKVLIDAEADLNVKDSRKSKKPALFHAAECGHLVIAETLMKAGADTRASSTWGHQPFFVDVVANSSLDMIKLFLDHGADANTSTNGRSVFILAVEKGRFEQMQLLQQHGAKINEADSIGSLPLHIAYKQRRMDIVQFLLQRGADPSSTDGTGNSLLFMSLKKKDYAFTKELLNRGANANSADYFTGKSPVALIVEQTTEEDDSTADIARLLLRKGGDANHCDSWGEPLMTQVMAKGNMSLLQVFLENGADPNKRIKNKEQPLLYALDRGRVDQFRLLLKHGADPNKTDADDRLPLVEVLQFNMPDLVRELLEARADVNKLGAVKPLALARLLGSQEVVQMLVARGAEAPNRPSVGTSQQGARESTRVGQPNVQRSAGTGSLPDDGDVPPAYEPRNP